MSITPNRYPENFKEDIFVNFCNLSSYMDFHFHSNHYEICCVMKGKLDYVCRSRLYSLSAYDIVFADKSEPHACDCPGESAEFVTINFTDAFLSTIPGGLIIKEMFDKGYLKTPSAHAYKISELITKMVFESDYPTVFSSNLVEGYVRELLIQIYRIIKNIDTPKNIPTNSIIEAATKYICSNFQRKISLEEVADFCHVNKYHLSRLFKEVMGVGLSTYLNTIRIHEASAMLTETDRTIIEIATLCGFGSVKNFCAVFKKNNGISAREFRKKMKIE